jgi:NAD(P)-dependent dehydrogenase (short-subunit alcohol dehydrogenase family)
MPEGEQLSVLVTGASSGIGEVTAKTLAKAGHLVFASMRNMETSNREFKEAHQAWAREHKHDLEVIELDVADDESVERGVAQALARAGKIDVVVNNAGASSRGPIESFTVSEMQALWNINVWGVMRVNNAVLPDMRARRSGYLILISSTLARVLPRAGGLYPASKWAIEGLTESQAYQVAPFGIDVTMLEPGSYPTPAHGKARVGSRTEVAKAYDEVTPPRQVRESSVEDPDIWEIGEAVLDLIELPAGQRPLRQVVGPVFTEGVPEYNEYYERMRDHMRDVLNRPDQATPWSGATRAR